MLAAVLKHFGTSGWCAYEYLLPDDLSWSRGGGASTGERLQIWKYRRSFACSSAAHLLLCHPVLNSPQTAYQSVARDGGGERGVGLGTPVLGDA